MSEINNIDPVQLFISEIIRYDNNAVIDEKTSLDQIKKLKSMQNVCMFDIFTIDFTYDNKTLTITFDYNKSDKTYASYLEFGTYTKILVRPNNFYENTTIKSFINSEIEKATRAYINLKKDLKL